MPKYGNMSGWKAIRTFNRDARINDGLSPYGYKARYANTGKQRRGNRSSRDTVLEGLGRENSNIIGEIWGWLTEAEQLEVNAQIAVAKNDVEVAQLARDKAESSIFFRNLKYAAYNAEWPRRFLNNTQELNNLLIELQHRANARLTQYNKTERSLNRIISNFDELISDTTNFLETKYVETVDISKKRFAKACGGEVNKNGVIELSVENWADRVSCALNHIIYLEELGSFVEENKCQLLRERIEILVNVDKSFVKFKERKIKLILPKKA